MRIKGLQMRAKVVVEGFFTGLHRSPYHGFSVEFSEYRQYTPGDDPRYLDWRLYARTDRYYVKRFEDETNLRCHLLVDMSRSMGFGSLAYTKVDYARTLAATFAYFLATQRDAVGLLTFHQEIAEYIPARFRPGHLHRLLVSLENAPAGEDTDLGRPMRADRGTGRQAGADRLALRPAGTDRNSCAKTSPTCVRAATKWWSCACSIRPSAISPSRTRPCSSDLESGRRMYVDPQEIRHKYLQRFAEHGQSIQEICGGLGIDLRELDHGSTTGTGVVRLHSSAFAARSHCRTPAIDVGGRCPAGESLMSFLTPPCTCWDWRPYRCPSCSI